MIEGVWAEVIVNGEHLRLFSEHNALGVQTSVYNVTTKTWIAPSESVDDIEQGKERAAEYARAYLKQAANAELPPLEWRKARTEGSGEYIARSQERPAAENPIAWPSGFQAE